MDDRGASPVGLAAWLLRYRCQRHCRGASLVGSARATCPAATSICAITIGVCSPDIRGVQPASSCWARSAETTMNSYALTVAGRVTMASLFSRSRQVRTALGSPALRHRPQIRTVLAFMPCKGSKRVHRQRPKPLSVTPGARPSRMVQQGRNDRGTGQGFLQAMVRNPQNDGRLRTAGTSVLQR